MINWMVFRSLIFAMLIGLTTQTGALAGTVVNSTVIAGITITSADVRRFEAQELARDANGQDTSYIMPLTIVKFMPENICFPSLWKRPIPKFSTYMKFAADINLPEPGEQAPQRLSYIDKFCLNGTQVFMDDASAPNIKGYTTNMALSSLANRDCAALPRGNDVGLLLFCFAPDHSTIDADISVVATDPRMLPGGSQVFVISNIVVTGIASRISTVPEGSPTCNEFHRRFGKGSCNGPFLADGHIVTVISEDDSLTFRVSECIQYRVSTGGCTDGPELGITSDVVGAIREKEASIAPPPKF